MTSAGIPIDHRRDRAPKLLFHLFNSVALASGAVTAKDRARRVSGVYSEGRATDDIKKPFLEVPTILVWTSRRSPALALYNAGIDHVRRSC